MDIQKIRTLDAQYLAARKTYEEARAAQDREHGVVRYDPSRPHTVTECNRRSDEIAPQLAAQRRAENALIAALVDAGITNVIHVDKATAARMMPHVPALRGDLDAGSTVVVAPSGRGTRPSGRSFSNPKAVATPRRAPRWKASKTAAGPTS